VSLSDIVSRRQSLTIAGANYFLWGGLCAPESKSTRN